MSIRSLPRGSDGSDQKSENVGRDLTHWAIIYESFKLLTFNPRRSLRTGQTDVRTYGGGGITQSPFFLRKARG